MQSKLTRTDQHSLLELYFSNLKNRWETSSATGGAERSWWLRTHFLNFVVYRVNSMCTEDSYFSVHGAKVPLLLPTANFYKIFFSSWSISPRGMCTLPSSSRKSLLPEKARTLECCETYNFPFARQEVSLIHTWLTWCTANFRNWITAENTPAVAGLVFFRCLTWKQG